MIVWFVSDRPEAETRIFDWRASEGKGKSFLIGLGFGLNSDTEMTGSGKVHGLERNRVIFVAKRVPCARELESYRSRDISSADLT